MDQNPLEPLYGENDQQVNEAEFDRPNSRNNQNDQLDEGRYQMFFTFYLLVIFEPIYYIINKH